MTFRGASWGDLVENIGREGAVLSGRSAASLRSTTPQTCQFPAVAGEKSRRMYRRGMNYYSGRYQSFRYETWLVEKDPSKSSNFDVRDIFLCFQPHDVQERESVRISE